jgi:hypothetical protein
VRAGVEEARLVVRAHVVTQAQRALDGDARVAEVSVVEDLGTRALFELAVDAHDLVDLRDGHVPPLVAETALAVLAAARGPHVARVEKLHLTLASLLLPVRHDPDVRADAGVVEHGLR